MANYDASSTNKSKKSVRTYKDLDLNFTRHPITNDVVKIELENVGTLENKVILEP